MPCRTYLMKEEAKTSSFMAMKDNAVLHMCSTDFMVKPGPIYRSANPGVLRNKNKNTIPAHWLHNEMPGLRTY